MRPPGGQRRVEARGRWIPSTNGPSTSPDAHPAQQVRGRSADPRPDRPDDQGLDVLFALLDGLAEPVAIALFGRAIPGFGVATTLAVVFVTGLLFSAGRCTRCSRRSRTCSTWCRWSALSTAHQEGPLRIRWRWLPRLSALRAGPTARANDARFLMGTFQLERTDARGTTWRRSTCHEPPVRRRRRDPAAERHHRDDLEIEDGLGIILSAGASTPALLREKPPPADAGGEASGVGRGDGAGGSGRIRCDGRTAGTARAAGCLGRAGPRGAAAPGLPRHRARSVRARRERTFARTRHPAGRCAARPGGRTPVRRDRGLIAVGLDRRLLNEPQDLALLAVFLSLACASWLASRPWRRACLPVGVTAWASPQALLRAQRRPRRRGPRARYTAVWWRFHAGDLPIGLQIASLAAASILCLALGRFVSLAVVAVFAATSHGSAGSRCRVQPWLANASCRSSPLPCSSTAQPSPPRPGAAAKRSPAVRGGPTGLRLRVLAVDGCSTRWPSSRSRARDADAAEAAGRRARRAGSGAAGRPGHRLDDDRHRPWRGGTRILAPDARRIKGLRTTVSSTESRIRSCRRSRGPPTCCA